MSNESVRPDSGPLELRGFSTESRSAVRKLESYGWTFTLSRSNHAIGHAPDGVTRCSVARSLSMANRSSQNVAAVINRWERQMGEAVALADEIDTFGRVVDAAVGGPDDDVLTPILIASAERKQAALDEALSAPEPRAIEVVPALLCDQCDYVGNSTKGLNQHKGHKHSKRREPSPALVEAALDFGQSLAVPSEAEALLEAVRALLGGLGGEERALYEARIATLRSDLDAAEARAERLQSDIDAWISLAPYR